MPCFSGLAVSIHADDGPITEYAIQRQQKFGRITTYIPVPAPQVLPDGTPRQSTFAVSITLLTPGMKVPYSAPKPTPENPYPQPATVGTLPGQTPVRGQYNSAVRPYVPHTSSPNETVAAYIYFDGRQKEEVATLLRKGEETWVNSRWVSIPESEGGGIAEREFLFREVGLERWLNGLDLSAGADKAKKIERRQKKLEKKRRIKMEQMDSDDDSTNHSRPVLDRNGILRYGANPQAPVEPIIKDEELSDDSSDDEPPEPEASGQIKVALFRVLASGEIKRGEYSPQFDVHDDEGVDGSGQNDGGEDVDHTTSFAKPKTLDPKSISTQTVTGIDPPDSPFAVFTFFYRGEKQLQKMGIHSTPDHVKVPVPSATKRKTVQTDFSKLGPLKNTGTKGFSSYRDAKPTPRKGSKADDDAMDSDDDDDNDLERDNMENDDDKPAPAAGVMDADEVKRQEEVSEGVRKIKVSSAEIKYLHNPLTSPQLKRQHSNDAITADTNPFKQKSAPSNSTTGISPTNTTGTSTPNSAAATAGTPNEKPDLLSIGDAEGVVASPFKKHRASGQGLEGMLRSKDADSSDVAALAGNGPELPPSVFAGSAQSTWTGGNNVHPGPSAADVNRQDIAAATALPDEDEEL